MTYTIEGLLLGRGMNIYEHAVVHLRFANNKSTNQECVHTLSLRVHSETICSHSGITISFTRQTNLHNLLTISLRGSARNIPSSPTSDDDYPSSSSHHPVPLLVRCLCEYSSMSCAVLSTPQKFVHYSYVSGQGLHVARQLRWWLVLAKRH